MNQGCLYVESENDGTLTCGIVLLPDAILEPPCIYTTDQIAAIQYGQARVPSLQNIEAELPLHDFASGLPKNLITGSVLPSATVITANNATTIALTTNYTLTYAEIVPFVNPNEVTPTTSNAWGVKATLFFNSSQVRDLPNLEEYNPPETVPGGNLLYFPKFTNLTRRDLTVMEDYAGVHGGYYYPLTSRLLPAFTYLYINQDWTQYGEDHYFNAPKTSYQSIDLTGEGLSFFDQYNTFDQFCQDALNSGAKSVAKHTDMGFVTDFYDFGHTAIVHSDGDGHWCSPNMPAIVFPGETKRGGGIAPTIGMLLLMGFGAMVSAGQIATKRRRVPRRPVQALVRRFFSISPSRQIQYRPEEWLERFPPGSSTQCPLLYSHLPE